MTNFARRTDPITSHLAVANAYEFKGGHAARILSGLQALGQATAHELSEHTGLTVVQVDRRLPELKKDGKVKLTFENGCLLIRNGFRVWEVSNESH